MTYPRQSFRFRLLASFLIVSLVPLLICSVFMVQTIRLRMTGQTEQDMREQSATLQQSMDVISTGFHEAVALLQGNEVLSQALSGNGCNDTSVNNLLFTATDSIRSYAPVQLYDLQGTLRYSTENDDASASLPIHWGVLYAAYNADTAPVHTAPVDNPSCLLQSAALLKNPSGDAMGYLVMELSQSSFQSLFDGKYGAQGALMILSPYWHPVYATRVALSTELAPLLREQLLSGIAPDTDSDDYVYHISRHEDTGLYLVLQQPKTINTQTTRILHTVSLSCALVCVIISILMSLPLSHQIFSPIQRLQKAFGKLEQDDLDVQIAISREDELGQLAQRFNRMVQALKQNREELVQNQRELNEAQIRMLQAQLNPHFLCNTLDTMKWIGRINRVPQIATMSTDLADILRFCISTDEFVPLSKELQTLDRYIEIQKIRLSDSFAFHVELPEELADCLVPKMLLQPIVENSIIHGLSGTEASVIRIRVTRVEPDTLRITVTDNGRGLPEDMAGKPYCRKKTLAGNHLGLYNVDTILSKHYGTGYGLHLDRGPDGVGTSVTATLPIRMEESHYAESPDC